jgi:hypothetical protein
MPMLHVSELYFANVRGGMLDGFPAVCAELGQDHAVGVSELVTSISAFAKSCVVKILGNTHDSDNESLFALCSSLTEQGYLVAAEIRGHEKRSWADTLKYKIALIDEQPWLMYACNELRYTPTQGGEIAKPFLAGIHYSTYCYLIPHRDNSGEDVFDFLSRMPGFRVLSSKTYRKTIPIKE